MDRPYRGKRVFDVIVALALAPFAIALCAICGLAIKLEDGGPVFYSQVRVGLGDRPFRLLKLRTMNWRSVNPVFPNSDSITKTGRILRRTSFDELPQLLNVLAGQMSLVGPRPTLQYQVDRLTAAQRRRHLVRPGITGLAQVRGRNELLWAARIEFDLLYVEKQSLLLDLRILAESLKVVVGARPDGHPANDPISSI